jgi:AraC-like DNA-binding protein
METWSSMAYLRFAGGLPPPFASGGGAALGEYCHAARIMGMERANSPRTRLLGRGAGWSASEFVCEAGPGDRAAEERHVGVSIAFVIEGSFRYRTHAGDSLLYPGAFLLGAAGRCYECGHEHGRGDRCVSFNYDESYFDELAHAATGRLGFVFGAAAFPPIPALLPLGARMAACASAGPLAMEELAALIPLAIATAGRPAPLKSAVAARDRARVAEILRLIENASGERLSLDGLARQAGLSKFHLLRVFAAVTGVTPYKYLLGLRLRRAAAAISGSARPISEIAYEEGFGDLSTFNAHFRAAFGKSPRRWRRS